MLLKNSPFKVKTSLTKSIINHCLVGCTFKVGTGLCLVVDVVKVGGVENVVKLEGRLKVRKVVRVVAVEKL
jgi:hypothetical protein